MNELAGIEIPSQQKNSIASAAKQSQEIAAASTNNVIASTAKQSPGIAAASTNNVIASAAKQSPGIGKTPANQNSTIEPQETETNQNSAIEPQQLHEIETSSIQLNTVLISDELAEQLQQAEKLMESGERERAIALYETIIAANSNCFTARINLGYLKQEQGELDAAIPHYKEALAIDPTIPQTAYNLAKAFEEKGEVAEAIVHYEQALAAEPNFVPALINLAVALQEQGELAAALTHYQRAIEVQPNSSEAYNNMATVLQEQGNLEAANIYYQKALELVPDFVEAVNNLGRTFVEKGELKEAIACYRRAISLNYEHASAHLNLSLALLLSGDFTNGFAEYEWRWKIKEFQTGHSCFLAVPEKAISARDYRPLWDGSDLQGKTILLHAEQGLGDTIQFVRYASIVRSKGGRVIVGCYPQLQRLFATVAGIDILAVKGEPLPEFDLQAPLLSLPYILGTTLETIPAPTAYLTVPPEIEFALLPDRNLKVGIVWAGNPKHRKNKQRSCSLRHFLPLLELSGVSFYSLQKELPEGDRELLNRTSIIDLSPDLSDFADTAAAISQLDLVISVDTSVAHLAGALGKPVWVLLAFSPDWRWLWEREDSPWYPTARLFRQRERGDWEGVFARVAEAVAAELSRELTSLKLPTEAAHPLWKKETLSPHPPLSPSPHPPLSPSPLRVSEEAEEALRAGRDLQDRNQLQGAIECYARAIAIAPNYAAAHSNLGVVKQRLGLLSEAIAHYRQALAIEPDLAETASNLGSALAETGDSAGAIAAYQRALELNPNCAEALVNLGVSQEASGLFAEAISSYQQAIQINPDCAVAYLNLAIAVEEHSDREAAIAHYERAIAHYQRAIAIQPDYLDGLHNLAYASLRLGKFTDAIGYYQRVTALQPDFAATAIGFANSLQQQDKLAEAVTLCQLGLQYLPDNAEARCILGIALYKQGKLSSAIAAFQEALRLQPEYPEALNNLGKALEDAGDAAGAIDCYNRAIELKPGYLNPLSSLGRALHDRGQFADAAACYSQAVEFNSTHPEAHLNLALALLLTGDFQRGFVEYEWRQLIKDKQLPQHSFQQPLWDGADLAGKTILLCPEQGLGDAIQFVRYVDLVRQKGGKIILWCLPHLQRLFAEIPGIEQLINTPEQAPDFDVRAQLMSLPRILGTTLDTVPANVPYLTPPPEIQFNINDTGNLKVGIVWSGNRKHSLNQVRSFPLSLLQKLLAIPGADFYSLQKDLTEEDTTLLAQLRVVDASPYLYDFADTAAVVAELDLVISVDTSVAHLAGAMGKPVWVLLSFVPDWRWLLEREDSPWYPTARLFRQETPGDWESVFDRAAVALQVKINLHQQQRLAAVSQLNLPEFQQQFNWGNQLKAEGKFVESIAHFKNALTLQPNSLEVVTNLAVTLHQIGNLAEAATYYQRAIDIDPQSDRAQNNLGILLQARGEITGAITCFQRAIELNPRYVKAINNLGATLMQASEFKNAIVYFHQALSIDTNYVPALVNLGAVLQSQNQIEEAKRLYQQAIDVEPDNLKGHYHLGNLYLETGKPERAIAYLETAIDLQPNYVEALNNLGSAVEAVGDVERAILCYKRAIELDPNCPQAHFNLSLALLLTGDLPRGFAEYQWRWETQQAQKLQRVNFQQPLWDGSDLNGKTILLRSEQGLGDAIHFVRYAAIVRAKGGKVLVSCYQELKRLFKQIPDIDRVAVKVEELPEFQVQAPLMSLPHILGTNLDNIPANVPYLTAPANWQFSLETDGNFKIGIVWAGSVEHLKDFQRSCYLGYFMKLLDVAGVTFYSLQKQVSADDRTLLNQLPVTDLSDNLGDFADTAAVISQLDLVICVDTAVAHLAGALGKPVWILLSFMPDWRWMLSGETSPWYPTARLFRQETIGDWDSVFDRVKTALENLIATHFTTSQAELDRAYLETPPRSCVSPEEVEFNIGNALQIQGKFESAEARYRRVITMNPRHELAHSYLGFIKQKKGELMVAIAHYQQAIEINPNSREANLYLGCALEDLGQTAEAISYYDRAIQLGDDSPNTHLRLALALLLTGNFQRGFGEYEWRWKTQELEPRYFDRPLWDGADLHGKAILLHPEQGFGDAIHFVRYAPLVKAKGGRVIVACHFLLKRLFAEISGVDLVVTNPGELPDFQVQAPLLSLPGILGTTLVNVPANIPYVTPPADAKFVLPATDKFKVGIVWTGGPLNRKNRERSGKLSDFLSLLAVSGASFYSLQKDVTATDRNLLNQHQIPDLSEHLNDFADTAAVISQLDLVICVDTSIAHLAGALGKPVWILLSFVPDWRWMLQRKDSPWYPTARLFRQQTTGDWEGAFDRVKLALQNLISNSQKTGTAAHPSATKHPGAGTGTPPLQTLAGTTANPGAGTGTPPLQTLTGVTANPGAGTEAPPLQNAVSGNANSETAQQNSALQIPKKVTGIGISWPVSITSGWGIYGMNLTLQLLKNPAWEVALLAQPSITSEFINPLHKSLLLPVIEKQKSFQELVTANYDKQIACNFPVLYALGNNLASSGVENQITSGTPVGVIFFEDTRIAAEAIEKAQKYSAIVAGSNWNADVLKSCGLTNVWMVNQGIDPAIFHPAPKTNLMGDRFVIFSGGKLEYRKGQDIVVAAFKRFRATHPDALLITAWHNFWPQYMLGIEQTGNAIGLPNINRDGTLGITQWLLANGLPADSFIDIGLIPNHLAGQIVREADCAVFTNRCEGGTNLVAMESMACGIPTILSANTGHLDLIYSNICYPLFHQGQVKPTAHFPGVEGWGESDVDEVVATLEQIYTHREEAKHRGLAAANFMLDWTWEKQVQRFLDVVSNLL
ncbi:MAG: tetratricopeptide repeat protein [Microcoleus sp.]